jgi:membrane associated rhomboid family serine protease
MSNNWNGWLMRWSREPFSQTMWPADWQGRVRSILFTLLVAAMVVTTLAMFAGKLSSEAMGFVSGILFCVIAFSSRIQRPGEHVPRWSLTIGMLIFGLSWALDPVIESDAVETGMRLGGLGVIVVGGRIEGRPSLRSQTTGEWPIVQKEPRP